MSFDDSGQSDLRDDVRTNIGAFFGPYDYIFLGYRLGIRDTTNTFHQYFMASSTLTANRLITLPEVDSDDTIVGRASNDTITGIKTINNYVVMDAQSAPSAPDSDTIRLYAKDNGSGTTELFYKNSGGSERNLAEGGTGGGGGGASNLDDLLDVAISGVSDDQFLRYDDGSGLWVNETVAFNHAMLSTSHTDSVAASAVLGDIIHANSTPAWARLAGNTTSTKKFLTQTGDGAISAAPSWGTLVAGDMPASVLLNTANNDLGAHYYQMTAIADPGSPSADMGRFYVKQVDSNNDGVYVRIKRNGSFHEVQVI